MYLTGGQLKSTKLEFSKSNKQRPTKAKVRQAIFDILQNKCTLSNCHVLDLCCGTGALGLEAYSRGAAFLYFVDVNIETVYKNCSHCGCLTKANVKIIKKDAIRFLKSNSQRFHLIFFDPPWHHQELYNQLLNAKQITQLLHPQGYLIVEMPSKNAQISLPDTFHIQCYNYGNTRLNIISYVNETRNISR